MDEAQEKYREKLEKLHQYEAFVASYAGKDLLAWLSDQEKYIINQLVIEPSQRSVTTDTLRGKLIMIREQHSYINSVLETHKKLEKEFKNGD